MTNADHATPSATLPSVRYEPPVPGGPRKPLFVPRHDDPPGLVQHDHWDRWVRLGVAVALAVAAVASVITFAPTLRRLATTPRNAASPQRVVAPTAETAVGGPSLGADVLSSELAAAPEGSSTS